jgi:hypothetical protein
MGTLFVTLHVLSAIFLIGPLALAPFVGLRAVVRRDSEGVRRAAEATMVLAGAAALVGLFGLGAVASSDRIGYGTPWVTISITLSVIALVGVLVVAAPSLRTVAALIEDGTINSDTHAKARMDALRGRIAATAGLAVLAWALVVVLMMTKPFA